MISLLCRFSPVCLIILNFCAQHVRRHSPKSEPSLPLHMLLPFGRKARTNKYAGHSAWHTVENKQIKHTTLRSYTNLSASLILALIFFKKSSNTLYGEYPFTIPSQTSSQSQIPFSPLQTPLKWHSYFSSLSLKYHLLATSSTLQSLLPLFVINESITGQSLHKLDLKS